MHTPKLRRFFFARVDEMNKIMCAKGESTPWKDSLPESLGIPVKAQEFFRIERVVDFMAIRSVDQAMTYFHISLFCTRAILTCDRLFCTRAILVKCCQPIVLGYYSLNDQLRHRALKQRGNLDAPSDLSFSLAATPFFLHCRRAPLL